ncbi:glycosyltransferase [Mailhella massiliensis]|uniref:glycosyltransferase n=1 Tax=Mailhella massiliensis TaxID=1903261 RepID=UPI00097D4795|nr:glycosyltransferase [Mailhella massiliensis]
MSTAVIFSCDNNYSVGVYINIIAIEKNNHVLIDKYIVYADSWDEENIAKIKSISNKVEIISFDKNSFLMENEKFNNHAISSFIDKWGHFKLGFSIYLLQLNNFDRIIFLDADVLVLSDISYLNTIESIGWRSGILTYDYNKEKLQRPNAGVLVFHKSIPYELMAQKYCEYVLKFKSDELALLILAYDLNINVINLNFEYNYVYIARNLLNTKEDIKIYHCVGDKKIWNSAFLRMLFPEFNHDLKTLEE